MIFTELLYPLAIEHLIRARHIYGIFLHILYVNTSCTFTNHCKALTKASTTEGSPEVQGDPYCSLLSVWMLVMTTPTTFTVHSDDKAPSFLWDTSNICVFDLSKATCKLFKSKMIQDKGPGPCNTTTPHHIMHPLRKHLAHGCLLTLPCVILPHKALRANLGGLFHKPNKLLCVCEISKR